MKTIFMIMAALLLGTTIAQAEMSNSKYNARHQALLEHAILNTCGAGNGRLTRLSGTVTEHRVDQGVIDLYFTTKFEMTVKVDQGIYDTYKITAQSAMYSAYDHAAEDWGIYAVESVACELQ